MTEPRRSAPANIETRARGDYRCISRDCPDCNCPAGWDRHPLAVLLEAERAEGEAAQDGDK